MRKLTQSVVLFPHHLARIRKEAALQEKTLSYYITETLKMRWEKEEEEMRIKCLPKEVHE